MVNQRVYFAFRSLLAVLPITILWFSLPVFAQGISAHVDRSNVGLSENFNLRVELDDAKALAPPDFSILGDKFEILDQQRSSITKIINGKSSSNMTWNLTLMPKQTGPQMIAPISIQSNAGILKTNPISVNVTSQTQNQLQTPGHSPSQYQAGDSTLNSGAFSLVARASKMRPYKDERVAVTFELATTKSLRNLQIGDLTVKDAIVERNGDPKLQTKTRNGREQQTLTVSYLVTPLKSGPLTIPRFVIRAEAPQSRPRSVSRRPQLPFGDQDSAAGPFAQMQQMMNKFMQDNDDLDGFGGFEDFDPFTAMQPVAIASQPLELNVQPAVPGVNPWLPASNLKLSETWSGEQKAGEPLVRTITVRAGGVAPDQLPNVEEVLTSNEDVKIYPGPVEKSEKVANHQSQSVRKQDFTIVPQHDGSILLPAVKVSWWDTQNQVAKTATLPEKMLHVQPGVARLASASLTGQSRNLIPPQETTSARSAWSSVMEALSRDRVWFASGFVAFALFIFCCMLYRFSKITSPSKVHAQRANIKNTSPVDQPKAKSARVHQDALVRCESLAEVNRVLKDLAHLNWGLGANLPLSQIFEAAQTRLRNFDAEKAALLLQTIERGLYARTQVDVSMLKSEIAEIFFSKETKGKFRRSNQQGNPFIDKLPELNPN